MTSSQLSSAQKSTLLKLARDSIDWGLQQGRALPVKLSEYDQDLQRPGACFVTLYLQHQLRGCIGSLEAQRPLLQDVSDNAFAAAFRDPRFSPLQRNEFESISLQLSVLSPSSPITFQSEEDLIAQIKPGVDGLILQDGHHRGTFLPSVWEQLPDPRQFLSQLKLKAGLRRDHWSPTLQVSRYHTDSFE